MVLPVFCLVLRVTPQHLWGLPKGTQESATHLVPITEPRLARHPPKANGVMATSDHCDAPRLIAGVSQ